MRKKGKRCIRWISITAALLFMAGGCSKMVQETQTKTLLEPVGASIDTDTVTRRDVIIMETKDAVVISDTYDLSFSVSGSFGCYYVSLGDFVHEGDVLAEISQDELLEQVAALEERIAEQQEAYAAQNQYTEIDLAVEQLRLQQARESGTAGAAELALQELAYQKSQVSYRQEAELQQMELAYMNEQLEQLRAELGEVRITAPCDGEIIGMISFADGQDVEADSPVLALTKTGEADTGMRISTSYISESTLNGYVDYYALIDGKRVAVTYRPYSDSELKRLKLYSVALPSYFEIDGQTDIPAGTYAKLCCVTSQALDTPAVVTNAVYRDTTGYYVYVIDEDGVRSRQDVTIGVKNDVYTEILSGLQEGDVVYVPN